MIGNIVRFVAPSFVVGIFAYLSFPQPPNQAVLSFIIGSSAIVSGNLPTMTAMATTLVMSFLNDPESFPTMADVLVIGIGASFLYINRWQRHRHDTIDSANKLLKSLVNYSPQPLLLISEDGVVSFATESVKVFLGYQPRELMGKSFAMIIDQESQKRYSLLLKSVSQSSRKQPANTQLLVYRKSKEEIWVKCELINLLNHSNVHSIMVILTDITERKHVDEKRASSLLREKNARAQAEQAVRTRDEFLSVASHELRTPLTTILLQLQTTLRRTLTQSLANFSGEKLVSSLKIAEAQSQRLKLLIRDLLNTSLVSTGRLEINVEEANLNNIVSEVIKGLTPEGAGKSQIIVKEPKEKPIIGKWDSIRLEQCITNLITNALKYSKDKPITIVLTESQEQATVSVIDQGVGIEEVDKARIFEPFERGKNNHQIKGLGVGLFIAKRVAEAHGGSITVASEFGRGSTFTLSIPLAPHS